MDSSNSDVLTRQLTEAIARAPDDPKHYAKRCTAYLSAGDYHLALGDAKSLVKLLPDAPVGYLKAARCYRLLKRWKAAQTMLDLAVERARANREDEPTKKALKTEMRKLQQDMAQPKAGRTLKPSWVQMLPEELFTEVAAYLTPEEVIKCTHVCQQWRRVLLGQPKLWRSLHLIVGDKYASAISSRTADKTTLKIQAYRDRLQGVSLRELSIYGSAKEPVQIRLLATSDHHRKMVEYGMLDDLQGFSISNVPNRAVFQEFYKHPKSLRAIHWHAGPCPVIQEYHIDDALEKLPLLESIEVLESGSFVNDVKKGRHIFPVLPRTSQSEYREAFPPSRGSFGASDYERTSTSQESTPPPPPHSKLRYLHASTGAFFNANSEDEGSADYRNLEHLQMENVPFLTDNPLPNVRTMILKNSCWSIPSAMSFDKLTELRIYGGCVRRDVQALIETWKIPNLRILTLQTPLTNPAAMVRFAERTPLIRELYISQVDIPTLSLTMRHLPQIQRFQISRSHLPSDLFLTLSTYNTAIEYLDVSQSANVQSGPLLRLVHGLLGKITYLNIDGCRELEKEAVDWIKGSVKTVVWSGWRDKNEPKPWKYTG